MKKAVALIAAVAMAGTSVAGYGATTVKADDKKEIYVLIKARGDLSYWDSMANGGDRAAEDFADEAAERDRSGRDGGDSHLSSL